MHAKPWRKQIDFLIEPHCISLLPVGFRDSNRSRGGGKSCTLVSRVGRVKHQQQHQQHNRETQKDSGRQKEKAGTVAEQLPSPTHPLPSGSTTVSHVLFRGAVYLFSPSRQIGPRENRLPWRSVLHSSFHSVL